MMQCKTPLLIDILRLQIYSHPRTVLSAKDNLTTNQFVARRNQSPYQNSQTKQTDRAKQSVRGRFIRHERQQSFSRPCSRCFVISTPGENDCFCLLVPSCFWLISGHLLCAGFNLTVRIEAIIQITQLISQWSLCGNVGVLRMMNNR